MVIVIPTLLVPGLALGLILTHRWRVLLAAGAVSALAWGVGVGALDDEPSVGLAIGAAVLGAANLAAGALVGVALRLAMGRARRRAPASG